MQATEYGPCPESAGVWRRGSDRRSVRRMQMRAPGRAGEQQERLPLGEVLVEEIAQCAPDAAQRGIEEPKVGEQGEASFRTEAVRLARTPSSVNRLDSNEVLGPHRY